VCRARHTTDWKTTIADLREDFDYFIFEDENKDDPIFLIGKIEKMTSRSIHLNYFSGAGNWDKKWFLGYRFPSP
jgi:hypothetical protein